MYHLITYNHEVYSIFCDRVGDTTGPHTTVTGCHAKRDSVILVNRYASLEDLLKRNPGWKLLASSENLNTFIIDYPELSI